MWEQIRANRRRSIVLISGMALTLIAVGWAAGELLLGPGAGLGGIGLALIIWLGLMIVYLTSAESILLNSAGARAVQREDSPRLFNIVDEMKLASGLSFTPRLYLIDEPAPNAFAVGRKPATSAIAVTTGLMYRLNRDELQGVLAHEMAHFKNRDVQFMTLAAVMLGSIIVLSESVQRSLRFGGRGGRRNDSRGGGGGGGQLQIILLVAALVFMILGPVMAQILYFACSRKREYLADASAAQFTRYPEGLASALEKISAARPTISFASRATAPMFIINPLAGAGDGGSVFSSHPPTADRIRVLRSMGGASLHDYEAAYRTIKGAAAIGPASLQAAPRQPMRAPSADGPAETRHGTRDILYRALGYLRTQCSCGLELSVPENYERDELHCIRCGRVIPIPAARPAAGGTAPPLIAPPIAAAAPDETPLEYQRTGQGWESFRCRCGHTVQLSPAFGAPHITCRACRRRIVVV